MIEEPHIAVCDAGPVIHLDELSCLNILNDFKEIVLADSVKKEVEFHRPKALKKSSLNFTFSTQKYSIKESLYTMCRVFLLHAGEMESLAIMQNNPGALFFTDDASARLIAENMGFKVHGTIGIILRAIRRRQLSVEKVLSILNDIPNKSSLYIKASLLENIIQKVHRL